MTTETPIVEELKKRKVPEEYHDDIVEINERTGLEVDPILFYLANLDGVDELKDVIDGMERGVLEYANTYRVDNRNICKVWCHALMIYLNKARRAIDRAVDMMNKTDFYDIE